MSDRGTTPSTPAVKQETDDEVDKSSSVNHQEAKAALKQETDDEAEGKTLKQETDDEAEDSSDTKKRKGSHGGSEEIQEKKGKKSSDEKPAVTYRDCQMIFNEDCIDGKFSGDVLTTKDGQAFASGRGTFIVGDGNWVPGWGFQYMNGGYRFTATEFGATSEGEICGPGRIVRNDGTIMYLGGFWGGCREGRGTEFGKDGVTPKVELHLLDGARSLDGIWEYGSHGFSNCYPFKPGAPAPPTIPEAGCPGHDAVVHMENMDDWIERSDDEAEDSSGNKKMAKRKGSHGGSEEIQEKKGRKSSDEKPAVTYRDCRMSFNEMGPIKGKFSGDVLTTKDGQAFASGRGTFIVDGDHYRYGGYRFTATQFGANYEGDICGPGRIVRKDGTIMYLGGFWGGWYEGRGTEFEKDGETPKVDADGTSDGAWEYATHGFISCFPVKPDAPAPPTIPEAGCPGHDAVVHMENWHDMLDRSSNDD